MIKFEDFQKAWLTEITEGNPNTLEVGRRFSKKLIRDWLDFGDLSDDIVFCDGTGDGGIDIAYLQKAETCENNLEEGDTWYLVQSKYGSAFSGTTTLLQEAQKLIDTLDGKRKKLSSLSTDLVERLTYFRAKASDNDRLVLVFATQNSLTESERRAMEDIRAMGKNRLGNIFDVDSVSIERIFVGIGDGVKPVNKTKVAINAHIVPSGEDVLVGSVSLSELFSFLNLYRTSKGNLDLLYEKNVRKFLGIGKKVNKGIEDTIINKPERFGLYNNGITIVVEDFKQITDAKYELTEPSVVNGCQTTNTIWRVLFKKLETGGTGKNLDIEGWKKKLETGFVVIKVVKVGSHGGELLTEITRYTNSQNVVREKDFLTLESKFQNWAKLMAIEHNLFLEIQRGGWDSQRAFQKQHPDNTKQFNEGVNAFDLLKVYSAAWLGEPGVAWGKNAPFAPSGSIFKEIVNNEEFGIEDLWAAFLIYKKSAKYKFGRGAEEQTRTITRFLFYMILIKLLKDVMNDAKIDSSSLNDITQSLLRLFKPENENACISLFDTAIGVVDEYLRNGAEYSVFTEPKFIEKGSNLNSFLKWEQLGKGDSTPNLNYIINVHKSIMTRKIGSQPATRDLVLNAIRAKKIAQE